MFQKLNKKKPLNMADIRLAGEAVFEETADLDEDGEDDDGVIEASPRKQTQV